MFNNNLIYSWLLLKSDDKLSKMGLFRSKSKSEGWHLAIRLLKRRAQLALIAINHNIDLEKFPAFSVNHLNLPISYYTDFVFNPSLNNVSFDNSWPIDDPFLHTQEVSGDIEQLFMDSTLNKMDEGLSKSVVEPFVNESNTLSATPTIETFLSKSTSNPTSPLKTLTAESLPCLNSPDILEKVPFNLVHLDLNQQKDSSKTSLKEHISNNTSETSSTILEISASSNATQINTTSSSKVTTSKNLVNGVDTTVLDSSSIVLDNINGTPDASRKVLKEVMKNSLPQNDSIHKQYPKVQPTSQLLTPLVPIAELEESSSTSFSEIDGGLCIAMNNSFMIFSNSKKTSKCSKFEAISPPHEFQLCQDENLESSCKRKSLDGLEHEFYKRNRVESDDEEITDPDLDFGYPSPPNNY
ncbi:hypothetical protein HDV02_001056 [Globomyces sp. JEL0801]|nr:hypothetical protein HDV02_001056 [Globomyces sp. JEL0801]